MVLLARGTGEARQVYRYSLKGSKHALYRLLLDSTESRLIPGSEDGSFPFFSPGGGPVEHVVGEIADARGITTPYVTHGAGSGGENFYSYIRSPLQRSVRVVDSGQPRVVVERGVGAQLLADGHLVYFNAGNLFAAPFSNSGTISGTPVQVMKGVASPQWFSAVSSVSRDGTLAYLAAERPVQPGPTTSPPAPRAASPKTNCRARASPGAPIAPPWSPR